MRRVLLILVAWMVVLQAIGQGVDFYGNEIKKEICKQLGFVTVADATESFDRICEAAGISNNFILVSCPGIGNCFAIHQDGVPYIVYDLDFMKRVENFGFSQASLPGSTSDWQALTILAHELGHHVCQHTTNKILAGKLTRSELELQADQYAGYILARLGATPEQARSAMYHPNVPLSKTLQYPSRQERIAAINRGYKRGKLGSPPPLVVNRVATAPDYVGLNQSEYRLRTGEQDSFKTKKIHIEFDLLKDFTVSFRVQSFRSKGSMGYGIAWNYRGDDEHMLFAINSMADGYYAICVGRSEVYDISTRFSEGSIAIRGETGPDELLFEKQGDFLIFSVNGKKVWQTQEYRIATHNFAFWIAGLTDATVLDWRLSQE